MSKTKQNFLYIVVSKVKVSNHESEKNANVSFYLTILFVVKIVSARVYSQWYL